MQDRKNWWETEIVDNEKEMMRILRASYEEEKTRVVFNETYNLFDF